MNIQLSQGSEGVINISLAYKFISEYSRERIIKIGQ